MIARRRQMFVNTRTAYPPLHAPMSETRVGVRLSASTRTEICQRYHEELSSCRTGDDAWSTAALGHRRRHRGDRDLHFRSCRRTSPAEPRSFDPSDLYVPRSIDVVVVMWCFWVGSSVGSFLNVVAWRMPRGESDQRPIALPAVPRAVEGPRQLSGVRMAGIGGPVPDLPPADFVRDIRSWKVWSD